MVEGSLAYCGVLHVLRCSSGRLFWLPWLQSGSHDHHIIHVAHSYTSMCKSWSLNTHKYTHIVNFNCIQICVALPYRIEYRCTAQSCQSRCVVYRRASIYVYAIPYGSICNAEIQTRLKFTVYTPVMQQSVCRGRAWYLLCTQALPCLTFHCRTVKMGDKVTHTFTQSHTHSHAP